MWIFAVVLQLYMKISVRPIYTWAHIMSFLFLPAQRYASAVFATAT